jgi:capsular polysaccharide export protein
MIEAAAMDAPRPRVFEGSPTPEPAVIKDFSPPRPSPAAGPRHFLLTSAPFGPFGRDLARELRSQGARCTRVILNAGDFVDWGPKSARTYVGPMSGWRDWLAAVVAELGITDIVTYGDSTPHAAGAIACARELGLAAHVLEQGYFRPDWVTLERDGVNAESRLPRDPAWYLERAERTPPKSPKPVGRTMPAAVANIFRYHLAMYLGAPVFFRFRASYRASAARQAGGHIVRYLFRNHVIRGHAQRLKRLMEAPEPLFLMLLQRPGDSQLWRHSEFHTTRAFLERAISSFASHAPQNARLMIRPHPLDPGLEPHEETVREIAQREGVADRVHFVDDGKLHEILPRTDGAVCVNSTAGLAAIEFGRPTIALGRALYDMPGMTHQGGLASFWTRPQAPRADLYDAFRKVVLEHTQINGAYATRKGRAMAAPEVARRLLRSGQRCSHRDVGRFEA